MEEKWKFSHHKRIDFKKNFNRKGELLMMNLGSITPLGIDRIILGEDGKHKIVSTLQNNTNEKDFSFSKTRPADKRNICYLSEVLDTHRTYCT